MRVLRWNFKHDGESPVTCELCLTGLDRDYELRVPREWSPIGRSIERFDDAFAAFQRHAMIERLLLDAGWTLRAFESLPPSGQEALWCDLVDLQTRHNTARVSGTTEVAAEYLEVIATRI